MYWTAVAMGFGLGLVIDMGAWGFRMIPIMLSTVLGK